MNTDDKNLLRPVSFILNDIRLSGYFHRWIISKHLDNGEELALALIEKENGEVIQIEAAYGRIKFTDR